MSVFRKGGRRLPSIKVVPQVQDFSLSLFLQGQVFIFWQGRRKPKREHQLTKHKFFIFRRKRK